MIYLQTLSKMKYRISITLNLPRQKVIELFDNPDNMKHWQKGFISFEHVSGTPGQEGAVSNLKYKMGKRSMELIETILKRDLPEEFHGTYDTKGVHNIQENYFKEIDEHTTEWISVTEFQFSGLMMKAMGFFMPGAFKKQSFKFMEAFKNFAENGISVAEKS